MANPLGRIPATLIDYNVYRNNNRLVGVGEVTLPTLTAQTADVQGAGIAGKVELPVLGHFDSMTVKINFRTVEQDATSLLAPVVHDLTFRAAQQTYNGSAGALGVESLIVQIRGMAKVVELGKLMGGESPDGSVEIEATYLMVKKGGKKLVEIDKLNGIFRVNGLDYSSVTRAIIGTGGGVSPAGLSSIASDASSVIDIASTVESFF